jgi:hypothetical protein
MFSSGHAGYAPPAAQSYQPLAPVSHFQSAPSVASYGAPPLSAGGY